ncbi:MAG: peptidylprolyl isomerase [Candidatus Eremiobacteraeota bacterium]|nr:peptidylprolyl isomerase [Candidatus Eremiobacteraeota bacterium]
MRFAILSTVVALLLLTAPVRGADAKQWDKTVVLRTSQGDIVLKLMPYVAPLACENFVRLVKKGYYNGLTFHRVIKGFMIQGGDPNGDGSGGSSIWGKDFKIEASTQVKFDKVGLLAMANSGPDSNGSQFFITTGVETTKHLNMKYTIFGKVTKGMEAVTKIENTPTGAEDKPLKAQKIIKAFIKESPKAGK